MDIAETSYYKITYSEIKNRIYISLSGFWNSVAHAAPEYLIHIDQVLALTKPHFTILVDASQSNTHPKEVMDLHVKAQTMVVEKGVYQVAEVLSAHSFVQMQADMMRNKSKLPRHKFSNLEEAEEWLENEVKKLKTKP